MIDCVRDELVVCVTTGNMKVRSDSCGFDRCLSLGFQRFDMFAIKLIRIFDFCLNTNASAVNMTHH